MKIRRKEPIKKRFRRKIELPPCLDETALKERILQLDEFEPIEKDLKKLVKPGELINIEILTATIKNLVAAEKLEIVPEPSELNYNGFCPRYKVNRDKKIDVTTFLKNLREIDATGKLGKRN